MTKNIIFWSVLLIANSIMVILGSPIWYVSLVAAILSLVYLIQEIKKSKNVKSN